MKKLLFGLGILSVMVACSKKFESNLPQYENEMDIYKIDTPYVTKEIDTPYKSNFRVDTPYLGSKIIDTPYKSNFRVDTPYLGSKVIDTPYKR